MSAATRKRDLEAMASVGGFGAQLEEVIRNGVKEGVRQALAEFALHDRMPPRPVEAVESVYVTRAQAARRTGYSLRTISRRIADGVLPAYGPRCDRIKVSDLDQMMTADVARKPQTPSEEDEIDAEVDRLLNDE
jgi:hypothetical protein